jgi:AcrR family transcriptional regulator
MAKRASGTRSTILKVALQLFLKKGYKDVSYEDLIKETGLSKGALYHHFRSKEDLLISTFEFLLEASRQQMTEVPFKKAKDRESFKELFVGSKKEQIKGIKKLLGTKTIKFNKLLFFFEAINENERLKASIMELMKEEMQFLEKCFLNMKKHDTLPKGKDPLIMAESLYWMLQGTEMLMFFLKNNDSEKDFIKIYNKTIDNFFKII